MTASRHPHHPTHAAGAIALLVLLLAALPAAAQAQAPAQAPAAAPSMSKADYQAAKSSIAAQTKTALAACPAQAGAARNACVTKAKNQDSIAAAELETRYKPGKASSARLSAARARADQDNARLERAAQAPQPAETKTPAKAQAGNTVRAGQSARVGADGRMRVSKNPGDLPVSESTLRTNRDLESSKMPSNKPVDVGAAAKAAKEGAR